MPTADHVNPRVKGGGRTIIVCARCNRHKAHHTLSEWAVILAKNHDFRARIVAELIAGLDAGTLQVLPPASTEYRAELHKRWPTGIADGIFA